MAINPAAIFSTLGNPNSLVPLAVKDLSTTAGMTAGSYVTGKEEGVDRFIDEFGTGMIWLLGIPAFKKLYDYTVFKAFGLDANFDPRNLENKDVFEKIKQYAPDSDVKKGLEKISGKQKLFKNLVSTRFVVSTGLTIASYLMLTKFKQKFTENKIKQNLIAEYEEAQKQNNKQDNQETDSKLISTKESDLSFKGIGPMVEQFAFSPVKNMYILEAAITGTRLKESRSPQELMGYVIKEGMTLMFLYYAGGKIQKEMGKHAVRKHNKSIALDARVIEGKDLKEAFETKSVEKHLADFKAECTSDAKMYEFLHKNPDNLIVKTAKQSDAIKLYKAKKWYQFLKQPDLSKPIDTRAYIDLKEIKEINKNINELYEQYKAALAKGETSDKFFKGVKKLKRNSVLANIGVSILALGVITPGIMLLKRLLSHEDTEFQTKKEIRQQLIDEGVIA